MIHHLHCLGQALDPRHRSDFVTAAIVIFFEYTEGSPFTTGKPVDAVSSHSQRRRGRGRGRGRGHASFLFFLSAIMLAASFGVTLGSIWDSLGYPEDGARFTNAACIFLAFSSWS